MLRLDAHPSGRHFLQVPGPTNVPDRILRAIDNPPIDHRGPEFAQLGKSVLAGMKKIFRTESEVVVYPSSGTGAWEAALVNTLSPGDLVLMAETGHFATLWKDMALRLGLRVEFLPGNWRTAAEPARIAERLRADSTHEIRAVCVVHNETATGVVSNIPAVRAAIDQSAHPALFMVDTISSLGAVDYRHDEWGVDVSVAGSQKGLMLPPGLSFNAVSARAFAVSKENGLRRSYWDWQNMLASSKEGYFPYTPATTLLYGLHEAIAMLLEEGLDAVQARHERLAEAVRRAVRTWGLEICCSDPQHYSPGLTVVMMPDGSSADAVRRIAYERFDLSLGQGLGKLKDRVFRIGHLGDLNDLRVCATLAGVEMSLALAGIAHQPGGVRAAMDWLAEQSADRTVPQGQGV